MIAFRNFALRRGERLLLSDVDLTLQAGWRLGVVGRNGTGKSSLFAALMGELEPDKGDLGLPGKARIASVAQETPSLPDAAIDFVLSGDIAVHDAIQAEANAFANEDWEAVAVAHHRLEELNGYDASARAGRLMHGLGFAAETHTKPVSDFSGGWRVRLNVARALMTPSDLLLLDEPTNHLDLDAVLWMEQWLLRYPGTLLVISHDREFLDNVTTHTLHLHEGKAKLYTGGYTSFEHQRSEQLRLQQITHVKEQAERAHLQSFIDRFKAKASKAKQAQSRMKRLAKLAGTEAVRAERSLRIEFPQPLRLPNSLIRLSHVDAGYPATPVGAPLWRDALDEDGQEPAPVGAPLWRDALDVDGQERSRQSGAPTRDGQEPAPVGAPLWRDALDVDGQERSRQSGAPTGDGQERSRQSGAPARAATTILHDINFGLEAGDRVGLLGPNGAGKSTLVKTLVGELSPLGGDRNAHPDMRIGYFAQHTVESLHAGQSAIEHFRDLSPNAPMQAFRDFLGKWNFPGDRAFENIDSFSGGERARLALALIAWRQPNVLLLDEPTNHLDLDMREALAEALSDFDGAIVMVSHDRHLIGLVCETFWRVAGGKVEAFDGDLDEYAAWLRSRPGSETGKADKPAKVAAPVAVAAPAKAAARSNPHKLQKAEARVAELESQLATIEAELASATTYTDGGTRAATLGQQQAHLRSELESAEAALLALYEAA